MMDLMAMMQSMPPEPLHTAKASKLLAALSADVERVTLAQATKAGDMCMTPEYLDPLFELGYPTVLRDIALRHADMRVRELALLAVVQFVKRKSICDRVFATLDLLPARSSDVSLLFRIAADTSGASSPQLRHIATEGIQAAPEPRLIPYLEQHPDALASLAPLVCDEIVVVQVPNKLQTGYVTHDMQFPLGLHVVDLLVKMLSFRKAAWRSLLDSLAVPQVDFGGRLRRLLATPRAAAIRAAEAEYLPLCASLQTLWLEFQAGAQAPGRRPPTTDADSNLLRSVEAAEVQMYDAPATVAVCGLPACQRSDVPLQRCSRCMVARYCSAEHQRSDWAAHKKSCRAKPA
jgi:hypothetical protein